MSDIYKNSPSSPVDEPNYESDSNTSESHHKSRKNEPSRNKNAKKRHLQQSSDESIMSSKLSCKSSHSFRALDTRFSRQHNECKVSNSNKDISLVRRKNAYNEREVPYYADTAREIDRIRRKYGTPPSTQKVHRRRREDSHHGRSRRGPISPDKNNRPRQTEKVPYFLDEARERERLRRKYRTPTPPSTSRRSSHRSPTSSRRRSSSRKSRSRSRSMSRSRSRSYKKKSSSDRHRSPKIITIPVPVPDYFAYQPAFASQHYWPRLSMPLNGPPMLPYSRHRYKNSYAAIGNRMAPLQPPPPSHPPMYYMPRFNSNSNFAPSPPMGPFINNRYRYPPFT